MSGIISDGTEVRAGRPVAIGGGLRQRRQVSTGSPLRAAVRGVGVKTTMGASAGHISIGSPPPVHGNGHASMDAGVGVGVGVDVGVDAAGRGRSIDAGRRRSSASMIGVR